MVRIQGRVLTEIANVLEAAFLERGPVDEVFMDDSSVFRLEVFWTLLRKWNVGPYFRAAYRPSGNAIEERHHRMVKAIAERVQVSPMDAVLWYNMALRSGDSEESVPTEGSFPI